MGTVFSVPIQPSRYISPMFLQRGERDKGGEIGRGAGAHYSILIEDRRNTSQNSNCLRVVQPGATATTFRDNPCDAVCVLT